MPIRRRLAARRGVSVGPYDVVKTATGRLVALFESSEGVSKGDLTINDLVVKNMRPPDAAALIPDPPNSRSRNKGTRGTAKSSTDRHISVIRTSSAGRSLALRKWAKPM